MEVFLATTADELDPECFLHVRGGVSYGAAVDICLRTFSPRAWRCFSELLDGVPGSTVFSTCVEVFPQTGWKTCDKQSFLHVRGGVSR